MVASPMNDWVAAVVPRSDTALMLRRFARTRRRASSISATFAWMTCR